MIKYVEYLCIAYLCGSCFTALGIWLGLRAIAGAILKVKEHRFPAFDIKITKERAGNDYTIRVNQ